MLFNSGIFIVLFFFVFLVYWLVPGRARQYVIIVTSFLFYGWYSIPFLLMFLALLTVNYWIGMRLIQNRSGRLLAAGIVIDVLILSIFKYFYLFARTAGYLIGSPYLIDLHQNWLRDFQFEIDLPIGISFYTFQVIAFVSDCYTGKITEKISPLKFYVFTLFFPHFVAGPIMRVPDLIPQIDHPSLTRDRMLNGCLLILQGIIKKVLIADRIGAATAMLWLNPGKYDAAYLIFIPFSWAFQVYCDFSGYTDMARGIAKLLGYEIPENFAGPFLSRSYQELWQRWHMTLSFWLRDYIYIPLGGSRKGELRTYVNLLITFAIGGLWHGANYNTIVWGIYTGIVLSLERMWKHSRFQILPEGKYNFLRVIYTYLVFCGGVLFFAAPSIQGTFDLVRSIVTLQRGIPGPAIESMVGLSILGFLLNVPQYYPGIKDWLNQRPGLKAGLVVVLTFVVGILVDLYGDVTGTFIYFKF